jgi:hypothetical protein
MLPGNLPASREVVDIVVEAVDKSSDRRLARLDYGASPSGAF